MSSWDRYTFDPREGLENARAAADLQNHFREIHEKDRVFNANGLAASMNRRAMQNGGFDHSGIAGMNPQGNYIMDGVAQINEAAANTQAAVQGKNAGLNTASNPTPAGTPATKGKVPAGTAGKTFNVQGGWDDPYTKTIGPNPNQEIPFTDAFFGKPDPGDYRYRDPSSYWYNRDKATQTIKGNRGKYGTFDLPDERSAKAYNSYRKQAPNFLKTDTAIQINALAKMLNLDPEFLMAKAFVENGGRLDKTVSVDKAHGILQVTPGTYKDMKANLPKLMGDNQAVKDMIKALPARVEDCTPQQLLMAGAFTTKLKEFYAKGKMKDKDAQPTLSDIEKLYFGMGTDGGGRRTKDHVNMVMGLTNYFKYLQNKDQVELPSWGDETPAGAQPDGAATQPTQVVGIDPSGTYRRLEAFGGPSQSPLGQEYTDMANDIAMLNNYKRAYLQTGAIDNYLQVSAQQTQLQMQLTQKLAELGAFELEHSGSPHRLLALLNGSTGGNYQVQLRSDGKIDLYNGGKKVSGKDGYEAQQLATYIKNMVSEQARQQYLATQTEAMKQRVEMMKEAEKTKRELAVAGINAQGQYLRGAAAAQKANKPGLITNTPEGETIVQQGESTYRYVPGQDLGNGTLSAPRWEKIDGMYGFNNVLPNQK